MTNLQLDYKQIQILGSINNLEPNVESQEDDSTALILNRILEFQSSVGKYIQFNAFD